MTTQATCSASPCVVGSTLRDTATLSGAASAPGTNGAGGDTGLYKSIAATNGAAAGGTINWSAYGPNDCTTAVTLGASSATVSGNGTYPTTSPSNISFTPTVVGTYTFVASYTGDSPNTNSLGASACPDPATGTEHIAVSGNASIASAQRWLPNDRVVITGDANLNGTVTVTLYPTNNCTGTAVSGQTYSTTYTNAASPQVFNTSNTSFFVGTKSDGTAGGSATAYSWNVHYDDTGLNDPADHCESSSLTISN